MEEEGRTFAPRIFGPAVRSRMWKGFKMQNLPSTAGFMVLSIAALWLVVGLVSGSGSSSGELFPVVEGITYLGLLTVTVVAGTPAAEMLYYLTTYWRRMHLHADGDRLVLAAPGLRSLLVNYFPPIQVETKRMLATLGDLMQCDAEITGEELAEAESDGESDNSAAAGTRVSEVFPVRELNAALRRAEPDASSRAPETGRERLTVAGPELDAGRSVELKQALNRLQRIVMGAVSLLLVAGFAAFALPALLDGELHLLLYLFVLIPVVVPLRLYFGARHARTSAGLALSSYRLAWGDEWLGVIKEEGKSLADSVVLGFEEAASGGPLSAVTGQTGREPLPYTEANMDRIGFWKRVPAPRIHRDEIERIFQNENYLRVQTPAGTQVFPAIEDQKLAELKSWAGIA